MSIRFTKSGILNTIQDLGRFGHRRDGINPGGAMDRASLRLLNILLGNNEGEAAIELHFPAGEILFETDCSFALAGADFDPHLNGSPIVTGKNYITEKGDVLGFEKKLTGQRAYLGVAGGFNASSWLGSKSTNLAVRVGGFHGRPLSVGDRLELTNHSVTSGQENLGFGPALAYSPLPSPKIRFIAGPEYDWLTPFSAGKLLSEFYRISSDSNRMGYRTEGEPLYLLDELELISSAVDFGTIQLLPSGQMVILMADHQTTGGYPRIGQVISRDLSVLGQMGPGNAVSFELVSIAEAEALERELENQIAFMKVGRRLKIGE